MGPPSIKVKWVCLSKYGNQLVMTPLAKVNYVQLPLDLWAAKGSLFVTFTSLPLRCKHTAGSLICRPSPHLAFVVKKRSTSPSCFLSTNHMYLHGESCHSKIQVSPGIVLPNMEEGHGCTLPSLPAPDQHFL